MASPTQPFEPPGLDQLALAKAFRADPLGRHGPELSRILSVMRSSGVSGKYCLLCVKPHAEWAIGRLSGLRGAPPTVEDNRVFHSLADAEWAVFKLRWRDTFGAALDEDLL